MSEQRNTAQELGDFLRTRRAALSPAESGVPTYGSPRRVRGLRREEVAQLAGVSVNYYTRIEQGESHQMSDSVRESIANALQLDTDERSHLLRLARPAPVVRRTTGPERVRDSVLALAQSSADQAAIIVGRRMDLLGGNRLGFALLGLRPDQRPNLVKMIFLDPAMRDPTTRASDSSSALPRRGRAQPSASGCSTPSSRNSPLPKRNWRRCRSGRSACSDHSSMSDRSPRMSAKAAMTRDLTVEAVGDPVN